MSFSTIIFNQNIVAIQFNTMQNYATWIQIVLQYILKSNKFMKTLQMMLRKDFTHQIMQSRGHHPRVKIKK